MMSQNLQPLQQNVELHLQHLYNFNFADVARAFLRKYNIDNKLNTTTIAHAGQLDENRFEIVRRMENIMSSKPIYERIIFNRKERSVEGFTFEKEDQPMYSERYTYKEDDSDSTRTAYDMFLYRKPGLQKIIRYKCHSWGVQTLTNLIKADIELKEKLKVTKEQIIEKKEQLIEQTDKLKKKVVEFAQKTKDATSSLHPLKPTDTPQSKNETKTQE